MENVRTEMRQKLVEALREQEAGWRVSKYTPTRVDTPYGSIGINWSCTTDGGATQRKAEEVARLIAAAPDLLEAARKVVDDKECYGGSETHYCYLMGEDKEDWCGHCQLSYAIAKAEGFVNE